MAQVEESQTPSADAMEVVEAEQFVAQVLADSPEIS